jgi:hypothetical protein
LVRKQRYPLLPPRITRQIDELGAMLPAEDDPGPTPPSHLIEHANLLRAAAAIRRAQREAENADH